MGFKTRYDGRVFYTDDKEVVTKNYSSKYEFIDHIRVGSKTKYMALKQYIPYNPSRCPICGNDVFFIRHNGGSMYFDPPFGWPWYRHGCFDEGYASFKDTTSDPKSIFGIVSEVINNIKRMEVAYEASSKNIANRKLLNAFQILLQKYHQKNGLNNDMFSLLMKVFLKEIIDTNIYSDDFDFIEILNIAKKLALTKVANSYIVINESHSKNQNQKIMAMVKLKNPFHTSYSKKIEYSIIKLEVGAKLFKTVKVFGRINGTFRGEPVVFKEGVLIFIRLNIGTDLIKFAEYR